MAGLFRGERRFALWLLILTGIILRFLPALQADFPLNDGGMFLIMIRDLKRSRFILPEVTSYNLANYPFAYPPLGMYLAGWLSAWFGFTELELLRWLPAIIGAMIVPVFYWLSFQVFEDRTKSFIAAALFAVLPGSFDWLVMGGGLSRSFGILFFLAAVGYGVRLFRGGTRRSLLPGILFSSLAVLSHPEAGLQTAGIIFLVWVLFGRSREGFRNATFLAAGVLVLTAPWWLAVLARHGLAPFLSAAQTGIRELLTASLFNAFFSMQGSLPILPVLSLFGLFATIRRRDFLLLGWAFLPFLLDPRNAPAIAIYAFVLLSSEGLYFLRDKFIEAYSNTNDRGPHDMIRMSHAGVFVFLLLVSYLFYVSYTSAGNLARISLKQADREAMEWVRTNVPEDSRFLLLTNAGQVNPMLDSYQEWFPALSQRRNVNTLQGSEWTLGSDFYPFSLELIALQSCKDTPCVEAWALKNDIQFEYLLVRPGRVAPQLLDSIRSDETYRAVYQSEAAAIYALYR